MEVILYLVIFYGGIALIGWFFDQIGKWNNESKSKTRDEVAQNILPSSNINSELIDEYKNKLRLIGFNENYKQEEISNYLYSRDNRSYKDLLGKCPQCKEGYLRVINGKYGKFLGCSRYSQCKYTNNLDKAKNELREKSGKEFLRLFKIAYQ